MKHFQKILITGGAGFIGHHLVARLLDLKHQVFVIDNLSQGSKSQLINKTRFYQFDVQNPKLKNLITKIKPDIVYHLAADSRVTSSRQKTLTNNVIATYNLLNCLKNINLKHFIFVSSAAVYGQASSFPIPETAALQPISDYGLSKLTGELYCRQFNPFFPSTVFRFANVYGPGQDSSSEGGVVAIFINQLLKNTPPTIFGTGKQVRDFIFVKDVVTAMIKLLSAPQTGIFNISSNQSTSINQLLSVIANHLSLKPTFHRRKQRPTDIQKSLLDNTKANSAFNWRPDHDLSSGLIKTINYFSK